jgi:uncharacterized membrane protein YhiD involved in acid resistance
MKVGGIILIVFGCLSIFGGIATASFHPDDPTRVGQSIIWGIAFSGIGIFLISRANKKKQEKVEKEKWDKGL